MQNVSYRRELNRQTPLVRVLNRTEPLGRRLQPERRSLDSDVLMAEARKRTKLEDFGDEMFREPMEVSLAGLRNDVPLSYFGQCLAHAGVVGSLCQRLQICREFTRHPEIADQPVPRPLIIVGPPRTGTTFLNRLLIQDPAARALRTWETLWPAPWAPSESRWPDTRRTAAGFVTWFANHWIVPDWNRIHPFTRDGPEECAFLMGHTFVNAPSMALRTYREWYRKQPPALFEWAYREYREALQLLHYQEPAPGHWVLKSPVHFWALDALLKNVPEACIVHTHRPMTEVLPSFCSLQAVFLSLYARDLDPEQVGPVMLDIAVEAVERFERARRGMDPERIVDLPYHELVADPIAAVRHIYDTLGYAYTPAFESRLQAFLREDRKAGRPEHQYSLRQFGLDEAAVSQAFAPYHQRRGH